MEQIVQSKFNLLGLGTNDCEQGHKVLVVVVVLVTINQATSCATALLSLNPVAGKQLCSLQVPTMNSMKPGGYSTQKLAAEAAAMEVLSVTQQHQPAQRAASRSSFLLALLNPTHSLFAGTPDSFEAGAAEGQSKA